MTPGNSAAAIEEKEVKRFSAPLVYVCQLISLLLQFRSVI